MKLCDFIKARVDRLDVNACLVVYACFAMQRKMPCAA